MKWWPFLLLICSLGLISCSALPEDRVAMETFSGILTFREVTALPSTAMAHVVVVPTLANTETKPIAEGYFPARTGASIPFRLKFPKTKVANDGEHLVLAQVIDHGKVWYSNLTAPLRIRFLADPSHVSIELRRESSN